MVGAALIGGRFSFRLAIAAVPELRSEESGAKSQREGTPECGGEESEAASEALDDLDGS